MESLDTQPVDKSVDKSVLPPQEIVTRPTNQSPLVGRSKFESVSGATPVPPGHVRFQVGERLAWKGLWFTLTSWQGDEIRLQVSGVTAKNKPVKAKRASVSAKAMAAAQRKRMKKARRKAVQHSKAGQKARKAAKSTRTLGQG